MRESRDLRGYVDPEPGTVRTANALANWMMATDAETFHSLCGDGLAALGFTPVNDPAETRGRYSDASADYECSRGLRLSVAVENDSGQALVFFGRLWTLGQNHARLSNHYAVLARLFGFDLPPGYPLNWGKQRAAQLVAILTDLQGSLFDVTQRVTLDHLIQVEREPYGAETLARSQFGENFRRLCRVSGFGMP